MKDFLSFLKTKAFFKHFALALVSLVAVIFIMLKVLDFYTSHGETVEVPDFTGQKIAKLDKFVEGKEVQYEIIDSIYTPGEKPGIVLKQDPLPKSRVKHNRKIYLYVTSVSAPQIEMPKLVHLSLRQALAMIESYGLKAGKTKFVAADCDGCVLKQVVNGKVYTSEDFKQAAERKKPITIKKGTTIELIVGEGESETRIAIPDLHGMTLQDALVKLDNNGLTYGVILPDEKSKDSLNMFVYKQFPEVTAEGTIKIGSRIDLFITKDKTKITEVKNE